MIRHLVFLAFLAIMPSLATAQFVKVYSINKAPTCNVASLLAYDVEDPFTTTSSRYIPYMDGCTAKIIDIPTGEVDYSIDLKKAGLDSVYALNFYRNLMASDGKWTIFYATYNANRFTMYSYINGQSKILDDSTTSYMLGWRIVDSNLYLIANGIETLSVYLVRNNVSRFSSILKDTRYYTGLETMRLSGREGTLRDVLGSAVDESEYRSMPQYMKRTIFKR